MSAKAFVALSKFGDVIQSLAIIEREYKKTGKKPAVITSEKYSEVFEGCSFVGKVIIYKGKWSDLHGAIKFAKSMFNDVEILQCHGENFPFQQTKPSFQHEVYDRAGLLGEWPNLRPTFDQRDSKREEALIAGHGLNEGKFILLADHGESSQFPQIEELKLMLNMKFGQDYKIVPLSKIKAHRIYDLLGIYERAVALVTTETVHTHLAWATNVPMFVLSANGWRGSAFRKDFAFYLKYADWERRKLDLIAAIEKFLNKSPLMKITTFETICPHGYNISSVIYEGNPVYTYRYHSGNWKTNLMICANGKQLPLQVDEIIKNYSAEDARIWTLDGKLFGIYTVAAEVQGHWKCYQAYGEITHADDEWHIGHIQIKYAGNDFTGTNKNFVPFVVDGKAHLIYGIRGTEQIVLSLDYHEIRGTHISVAPKWPYGEIRGGIVLARGDTLLRFFHSRKDYPDRSICYFVGAAIMEAKPPFRTLSVCKAPVLQGDDEFVAGCKHWKGRVVFPLGAIQTDDKILLSYGHNDCGCRIVELSEGDLNL